MDGRLGRLNCRYRVISDSGSGSAAPARLDSIIREQLAEACERSLEGLMGKNPAVYVVRRVEVSLAVNVKAAWDSTGIARKWGMRVAEAAVREVALRESGSVNVVRFEDQADYVASFVADLLTGNAWNRWFYGSFAPLRRGSTDDTVMAVLVKEREHLPRVLARLRHYGALERLLTALDGSSLERIWSLAVHAGAPPDSGGMRPLFAAALRLGEIFGMRHGRSPDAEERLFGEYLTSGHAPPDWRDGAALTSSVLNALQFLRDRGYITSGAEAFGDERARQWQQVRDQFDWLDFGALKNAMALRTSDPGENGSAYPDREPGALPDFGGTRPLFAAALRLAEIFGMRNGRTPHAEERLFEEYLTSGNAAPDWRDGVGLALSVLHALQFLRDRGYITGAAEAFGDERARQWQQVRDQFDWLDVSALEKGITLRGTVPAENESVYPDRELELPLRPVGLTPRRRKLISDLASALSAEPAALRADTDLRTTRLRVYALLAECNPEWAGDPLVEGVLEGLLATASWITGQLRLAGDSTPAWITAALAALVEHGGRDAELARQLRDANPAGALDASLSYLAAAAAAGREATDTCALRLMLLLQSRSSNLAGDTASTVARILDRLARQDKNPREKLIPKEPVAGIWVDAALAGLEREGAAGERAKQFLHSFGEAGLDLAVAAAASGMPVEKHAGTHTGMGTGCAGIFLLVRALVDAKVPSIAKQAGYPVAPFLIALGLRWAGERGLLQGRVDPGLCALAGYPDDMTVDELRTIWRQVDSSTHQRFQSAMLKSLSAQRVSGGPVIAIYRLDDGIVCGAVDSNTWPLARIVNDASGAHDVVTEMMETWRGATGQEPEIAPALEASEAALRDSLDSLDHGRLGLPEVDLTLGITAISLLRVWARWLRGFSTSSAPYLLQNLIRRPGRIARSNSDLFVELAPGPLDVVLEMSGYASPFRPQTDPWQGTIDLKFRD